jgi:microcystin degradation protein MlrC
MRKKVALLGIYHETNTFIEIPTTLADFQSGYWLEGNAIRHEYEGAHHEISGIIEVIDRCPDMELVPVFYASATPGGLIQKETYEYIVKEMMEALDRVLPIDGCIVVPHGAGVAEGYADLDGHWLGLVRERLGSGIPITGTLDPHANVSPEMVRVTDALVAYRTNPHIDQHATGAQAASLMVRILRKEISPVQHLVQLPMAISIEQQFTAAEPCKSLYSLVKEIEKEYRPLLGSVLLGFPYADVREMGSGFLLIATRDDAENLVTAANRLTEYMLSKKGKFNGPKNEIAVVAPTLLDREKPVLLLDMGDNVGGGAPGYSTHLLEFFEEQFDEKVFICVYDPEAVVASARYTIGESFHLEFGERRKPFRTQVVLQQLNNGIFTEDTPKHGGFINYDMGPTSVVTTQRGNTVMLTSKRTPPYSLRQLTAFGLEPDSFDYIVAKGVNAPIAAYRSVCPSIVQVDTPGVTQADMTLFSYNNRRRPLFPFESEED